MKVELTVGKIDAGMAILLTKDHHVIELPSLLLPEGIKAGQILGVLMERDKEAENQVKSKLWSILDKTMSLYGKDLENPVIVIDWRHHDTLWLRIEGIELNQVKVRGVDVLIDGKVVQFNAISKVLYRVGKLEPDKMYKVQIKMRTSSGNLESEVIEANTRELTDWKGIRVAFVSSSYDTITLDVLKGIVEKHGGKCTETLTLENTHLIANEGVGDNHEKAIKYGIPVVKKEWLENSNLKEKPMDIAAFLLHNSE